MYRYDKSWFGAKKFLTSWTFDVGYRAEPFLETAEKMRDKAESYRLQVLAQIKCDAGASAWFSPPQDQQEDSKRVGHLSFLLHEMEGAVSALYEAWYVYRNRSGIPSDDPPKPRPGSIKPAPYENQSFEAFCQQQEDQIIAQEFIESGNTAANEVLASTDSKSKDKPTGSPMQNDPDLAPYRPPPEAALIAQGQDFMRAAKAGRQDNGKSFAPWAINVELASKKKVVSRKRLKEAVKRFIKIVNDFKATETDDKQTRFNKRKQLVEALNKEYYWDYNRDEAFLVSQLLGEGGNCESQSVLIATAFSMAGLLPQGSSKLVAQNYDDHLQVAEYDQDSKTAYNYLTKQVTKDFDASLYDWRLLTQAYIEAKGDDTIMSPNELRVVEGKGNDIKRTTFFNTNTIRRFPRSNAVASSGEIPEHAVIGPPGEDALNSLGKMPALPENGIVGGHWAGLTDPGDKGSEGMKSSFFGTQEGPQENWQENSQKIELFSELDRSQLTDDEKKKLDNPYVLVLGDKKNKGDGTFYYSRFSPIRFRNQIDSIHYQSLSDKQKDLFTEQLNERSMNLAVHSDALASFTEDLKKPIARVGNIGKDLTAFKQAMDVIDEYAAKNESLLDKYPEISRLKEARDQFVSKLDQDPEKALSGFSAMYEKDKEQFRAFWPMVKEAMIQREKIFGDTQESYEYRQMDSHGIEHIVPDAYYNPAPNLGWFLEDSTAWKFNDRSKASPSKAGHRKNHKDDDEMTEFKNYFDQQKETVKNTSLPTPGKTGSTAGASGRSSQLEDGGELLKIFGEPVEYPIQPKVSREASDDKNSKNKIKPKKKEIIRVSDEVFLRIVQLNNDNNVTFKSKKADLNGYRFNMSFCNEFFGDLKNDWSKALNAISNDLRMAVLYKACDAGPAYPISGNSNLPQKDIVSMTNIYGGPGRYRRADVHAYYYSLLNIRRSKMRWKGSPVFVAQEKGLDGEIAAVEAALGGSAAERDAIVKQLQAIDIEPYPR